MVPFREREGLVSKLKQVLKTSDCNRPRRQFSAASSLAEEESQSRDKQWPGKNRTQSSNLQTNFLSQIPCYLTTMDILNLFWIYPLEWRVISKQMWDIPLQDKELLHHIQNFPRWTKSNNRIWNELRIYQLLIKELTFNLN